MLQTMDAKHKPTGEAGDERYAAARQHGHAPGAGELAGEPSLWRSALAVALNARSLEIERINGIGGEDMALSADILRGYTDSIILRQLAEGDSYGYQINKRIAEVSAGGVKLKEATLYTAFRRLETAGCIRSYWGDEASGARRRYYSITDAGLERLLQDCDDWRETKRLIDCLIGEDGK